MRTMEMPNGIDQTDLSVRFADMGMKSSALRHAPGRQVLIVEGQARSRDLLHRAVRDMGFTPTTVGSAESAMKRLAQQEFDIIVFGVELPGMSGLEMLETLRRDGSAIQAILLTNSSDLETARRAIHLDVVDYLPKPCTMGNLERALERARGRCRPGSLPDLSAPAQPEARAAQVALPADTPRSLEELEQQHILAVLNKNAGKRNATAAELGISLRKLYYRLGQYQKRGLIP
jgi:DNA-binding NtrC family response regulator